MEGGADARVNEKCSVLRHSSHGIPLVKCGSHSLSNSSYHEAPKLYLILHNTTVYVICLYRGSFHEQRDHRYLRPNLPRNTSLTLMKYEIWATHDPQMYSSNDTCFDAFSEH